MATSDQSTFVALSLRIMIFIAFDQHRCEYSSELLTELGGHGVFLGCGYINEEILYVCCDESSWNLTNRKKRITIREVNIWRIYSNKFVAVGNVRNFSKGGHLSRVLVPFLLCGPLCGFNSTLCLFYHKHTSVWCHMRCIFMFMFLTLYHVMAMKLIFIALYIFFCCRCCCNRTYTY